MNLGCGLFPAKTGSFQSAISGTSLTGLDTLGTHIKGGYTCSKCLCNASAVSCIAFSFWSLISAFADPTSELIIINEKSKVIIGNQSLFAFINKDLLFHLVASRKLGALGLYELPGWLFSFSPTEMAVEF